MKNLLILSLFLISLTAVSAQEDTITTESGLKYIVVKSGDGEFAQTGKSVEVHYTGYFTDGRIFDSSAERNEPIEFVLGKSQVIKGWDEGISLMKTGDKFKLIIPPGLAYGEKGAGNVIPPNATLLFDVELISVSEPKLLIESVLFPVIMEHGIDSAKALYYQLKADSPDAYSFKESRLNSLGYSLLNAGKKKEAIEIFKLNIEAYPGSANVYDSIGEAYLADGDSEQAIINYEKSLELNPGNTNAKEMLMKIKK